MLTTVRIDAQNSNDRARKTAKEVVSALEEGNAALVTNLPYYEEMRGVIVFLKVERLAEKAGIKVATRDCGEDLLFLPEAPEE